MELGQPKHFKLEDYFNVVRQLVASDEIELAMYMLDHAPAWHRDHSTFEITEFRNSINRDLLSVFDYAADSSEADPDYPCLNMDDERCYPRGPAVRLLIEELNKIGKTPHIHEISPANFWLKQGLKDRSFTYSFKSICQSPLHLSTPQHDPIPGEPTIFVCFETIEHLWRPDDIKHWCDQFSDAPDYVFLSTPTYCLGGGLDWSESNSRPLGHLRTYSPQDLISFAQKHWPGYEVRLCKTGMQVLLASKEPLWFDLKV